MTFAEFQKKYYLSRQDISRKTYLENRKTILIKKEATAVKNLDIIYGGYPQDRQQKRLSGHDHAGPEP